MKKGFDANVNLAPNAAALIAAGYRFVCRYYNVKNQHKNLTLAEAKALTAAGLSIVAVYEDGFPTSAAYFSRAAGVTDGTHAYQFAEAQITQPAGTPIYFAVDYDASTNDANGVIADYFEGVREAFNKAGNNNPAYLIGVYGSGRVCSLLLSSHAVTHTWLAQSTGWAGFHTFTGYNIKQLPELTVGGVDGDGDESPNDNEGSFIIV